MDDEYVRPHHLSPIEDQRALMRDGVIQVDRHTQYNIDAKP